MTKYAQYIESSLQQATTMGSEEVVKHNLELARIHMLATFRCDTDAIMDICSDDVVFEFPKFNIQIQGKKHVWGMHDMFMSLVGEHDLTAVPQIFICPDRMVIEINAFFVVVGENESFENSIPVGTKVNEKDLQIFDVRDGKICRKIHCNSFAY